MDLVLIKGAKMALHYIKWKIRVILDINLHLPTPIKPFVYIQTFSTVPQAKCPWVVWTRSNYNRTGRDGILLILYVWCVLLSNNNNTKVTISFFLFFFYIWLIWQTFRIIWIEKHVYPVSFSKTGFIVHLRTYFRESINK